MTETKGSPRSARATGFGTCQAWWPDGSNNTSSRLNHQRRSHFRQSVAAIATGLGGRKCGAGWMARCPAHDDSTPSLSIHQAEDGTPLVHCHAGCTQAQVIDCLRAQGLWHEPKGNWRMAPSVAVRSRADKTGDDKRVSGAMNIWNAAEPIQGSFVEAYLASRQLHLKSPVLRFHRGLKHPSGGVWPVMVALVTSGADDIPTGIHRTYLARDGMGKAPVDRPKMMLGPCCGGSARLAACGVTLMVGEGIETCLSAMQATGLPAWAALSAAGLRALILPHTVRQIIVLADGDEAGRSAALACASRWKREGRRVRIAQAPAGTDFNDLLVEEMTRRPGIGG